MDGSLRPCFLRLAVVVAASFAPAAGFAEHVITDAELFPRGHVHFSRCWQLEHDYYALRRDIAQTGVVWRRQELEQRWEKVRDQRREACLMGW